MNDWCVEEWGQTWDEVIHVYYYLLYAINLSETKLLLVRHDT